MSNKKIIPPLFLLASLALATLFSYQSGGSGQIAYLETPCFSGVLHIAEKNLPGHLHGGTAPGTSSIYSLDHGVVAGASFQQAEIPGFEAFNAPVSAKKRHTRPQEAKCSLITFNFTNKSPPGYLL